MKCFNEVLAKENDYVPAGDDEESNHVQCSLGKTLKDELIEIVTDEEKIQDEEEGEETQVEEN